ncbi:5'-3' exonuclease [Mycoplasmopsis meleagridis]|uniref:5'-3' exonuclease n=1 Tax=Mycoplasmopsis meleagridis TaxID=29561 RepID=UPI003A89AA4C
MEKFLLIDGNLLLFQSFFASYNPYSQANLMKSPLGITTNGVHVFLITLAKLINYFQPKYLFIAFDANAKTKRHQMYSDYKSGRNKAPEIIFEQFFLIKDILKKLNIAWEEKEGDEADDLIASLSSKFKTDNYIYSKDKDLLQLVKENISIVRNNKEHNFEIINEENFRFFYGFNPEQVADFKALAGDSSDNLPGVNGIGDKGATKLINEYGNLENIYENLDSIKGKLKEKLTKDKDQAFLCKNLALLNKNVEMNHNLNFYANYLNNADEGFLFLEKHGLNKAKEYLQGIARNKNE